MKFKEARISKGLTQEELASALGISRTTVSMWEVGSALPRADRLPDIANLLGCTIDELIGNKPSNGNAK
ncbi:MAG: helix-turn-helix transcriptional regulator [Clostridiales bacterium]|nr:helix-turn-helix transcriptional regulator [Clostridiales bacterium]